VSAGEPSPNLNDNVDFNKVEPRFTFDIKPEDLNKYLPASDQHQRKISSPKKNQNSKRPLKINAARYITKDRDSSQGS
jgi:hypothetical protein